MAGGNGGRLFREIWLKLADTRAVIHPEDALRLYLEEISKWIEPTANGNYDAPIFYLLKVRAILLHTGQEARLKDYVSGLRETFKRKRNFIKLLDQNGFPN